MSQERAESRTMMDLLADRPDLGPRCLLCLENRAAEALPALAKGHLLIVDPSGTDQAGRATVLSSISALPFPAGCFDAIVLDKAVHTKIESALNEAFRCLRPGGDLLIVGSDAPAPIAWSRPGLVQLEGADLGPASIVRLRREQPFAIAWRDAVTKADRDACLALRRAVFVEEQGVPLAEEYEPFDEIAPMLLATVDGEPAGTLRWQHMPDGSVKIQRVAVAIRWRGRGIAGLLLGELLARLDAADVMVTRLGAQLSAQGLYERFGYKPYGDVFQDGGISHISMARHRPERQP